MKKAEIEKKTEELVVPIIERFGYELWDVEYVKEGSDYYLRIYADKEGGFTVDDCEAVSRALDPLLDEEDFISDAYILEVSSPGLTRKLVKDRDFERSIDRLIRVNLYKAVDGEKSLVGTLKGFDKENLSVEITDDDIKMIPRNNISMVRLEFEP
jgi:Uncharacterized protein conserved in bacteria